MIDFKFENIEELKLARQLMQLLFKVADQNPQQVGAAAVRLGLNVMDRMDAILIEIEKGKD